MPAMVAAGLFALLMTFAGEADAQVRLAAEGRAGVTFPQGDLSDAGAETGLSVGAEVQMTFQPNLTAYLGLHRHAFTCDDECTRGLGDSPTSTGLALGLKYIVHSPGDAFLWGRGGLVANTLDDRSSDREIGFELGVGVDMPIAPQLHLVPNIGFIGHSGGNDFSARFFTLGVGLHYHFH